MNIYTYTHIWIEGERKRENDRLKSNREEEGGRRTEERD